MIPFQAILLGALQGLTELFPVSSLGHSVLIPHLLGWGIAEESNLFVIFLVATHLATSLVLFAFYRHDWMKIIKGILRSLKNRSIAPDDAFARLGWLLVIATIPAGIIGLLFESSLKRLFASPIPVSIFLVANGMLLLVVEQVRRKNTLRPIDHQHAAEVAHSISWWQGIKIGLAQCLALLPGFSRTGATLGEGLLVGLPHVDAAYFSFMLATPIIFAASVLKLPELARGYSSHDIGLVLLGAFCSAVAAYIAVRFLSHYFKTKTLRPFGVYCIVAGAVALIVTLLA